MSEDDPFGKEAHDKQCPTHSKESGHFCDEFDGLWICKDCSEALTCRCFGAVLREETPEEIKAREEFYKNPKYKSLI